MAILLLLPAANSICIYKTIFLFAKFSFWQNNQTMNDAADLILIIWIYLLPVAAIENKQKIMRDEMIFKSVSFRITIKMDRKKTSTWTSAMMDWRAKHKKDDRPSDLSSNLPANQKKIKPNATPEKATVSTSAICKSMSKVRISPANDNVDNSQRQQNKARKQLDFAQQSSALDIFQNQHQKRNYQRNE